MEAANQAASPSQKTGVKEEIENLTRYPVSSSMGTWIPPFLLALKEQFLLCLGLVLQTIPFLLASSLPSGKYPPPYTHTHTHPHKWRMPSRGGFMSSQIDYARVYSVTSSVLPNVSCQSYRYRSNLPKFVGP